MESNGCLSLDPRRLAARERPNLANGLALVAASTPDIDLRSRAQASILGSRSRLRRPLVSFFIYDQTGRRGPLLCCLCVCGARRSSPRDSSGYVSHGIIFFTCFYAGKPLRKICCISLAWGFAATALVAAVWYVPVYIQTDGRSSMNS